MTTYVRKPLPIDSRKSRMWALASLGSVGAGIKIYGGSVQLYDLVNRETHRAHRLELKTTGVGLGPLPISGSFSASDYEDFVTPSEVNFFDFNGTAMTVRETNAGLYSWTTVSFWGMSVSISSLGPNIPNIGASGGVAKILFSDGSPVGTPDLIVAPPPVSMPPRHIQEGAPEEFLVIRIPGDLLFGFDKHLLKMDQQTINVLAYIGGQLGNVGDYKYLVVGHTDGIGGDEYNMRLSRRRAETVAAWFKQHSGVRHDFIKTDGRGKTDPIASNATADGRAKNRRVEVLMVVPRVWNDY
jgi:outer membrane protein OmpA-like peptidoglycan-associated protein